MDFEDQIIAEVENLLIKELQPLGVHVRGMYGW